MPLIDVECPQCDGLGYVAEPDTSCSMCNGTGLLSGGTTNMGLALTRLVVSTAETAVTAAEAAESAVMLVRTELGEKIDTLPTATQMLNKFNDLQEDLELIKQGIQAIWNKVKDL